MKILYICENNRILTARMNKKTHPKPLRKLVFEQCEAALTGRPVTIDERTRVQLVRDYVSQFNQIHGTRIAAIHCRDGMELRDGSLRVRSGLQRAISHHVSEAENNLVTAGIDTAMLKIRDEFEREKQNRNLIPE